MALIALAGGCEKRDLRGSSEKSTDGRTYLIVADDNGGGCGPILVDGRPQALGARAPISAGVHSISCGLGGDIKFTVAPGTIFRFDYWGP